MFGKSGNNVPILLLGEYACTGVCFGVSFLVAFELENRNNQLYQIKNVKQINVNITGR